MTDIQNGKNILPTIVEHLKTKPFIDIDDVVDNPKKYPFTRDDFHDAFYYLYDLNVHREQEFDYFPEYVGFFKMNGTQFIWRLLIGQGSALQMIKRGSWSGEYKEDIETEL